MVEKTTGAYQSNLIGIISVRPALLLAGDLENVMPVALSGRVPLKVSLENGEIKPGDSLTSASSTPGVAMKAMRPGRIIGFALESFSATTTNATTTIEDNLILAFVNPSWQGNDLSVGENSDGTLAYFDGSSLQNSLASLGLQISQDGILQAPKIVAQDLQVGSTSKPSGITLYDEDTGAPYCLKIKFGAMISLPGSCASSSDAFLKLNSTSTPETLLISYPESLTQVIDAKFEFSCLTGIDGGCSFQCKVNDNDWAKCESPKTYVNLTKGEYEFQVFSVDSLGRSDSTPEVYKWTIDQPAESPAPRENNATSSSENITEILVVDNATSTVEQLNATSTAE